MPAKAYGGARPKVLNTGGFFLVFLVWEDLSWEQMSSSLPFFPGWCTFGRGLGLGFGLWVFYFVAKLKRSRWDLPFVVFFCFTLFPPTYTCERGPVCRSEDLGPLDKKGVSMKDDVRNMANVFVFVFILFTYKKT